MISNQILQNTLDGLKEITRINFRVYDADGNPIATTFPTVEIPSTSIRDFIFSQADTQTIGGEQYFKITDDGRVEFVLIVSGDDEMAHTTGRIAVFQIHSLLVAYRERFDKDNFVKNLLLDNLLLVDIYNRAKKLHIETGARRCVFIVEADANSEVNVVETVSALYPEKNKDFVTAVDEKNTILVKDVGENWKPEQLEAVADTIVKTLHGAGLFDVNVAYGTVVNEIKEVSKTYKEARTALDVGKIFYEDHRVVGYARLGIGRLIYQLPIPLCKMFIKETFDGRNPDEFDEETISTVNKFFENNLNVSETSRQLYIHRNTLVYRIDKLQKATGLDLRVFDDAITFKIAMMVGKYMRYMEKHDF